MAAVYDGCSAITRVVISCGTACIAQHMSPQNHGMEWADRTKKPTADSLGIVLTHLHGLPISPGVVRHVYRRAYCVAGAIEQMIGPQCVKQRTGQPARAIEVLKSANSALSVQGK
jgi:hypothetical protein